MNRLARSSRIVLFGLEKVVRKGSDLSRCWAPGAALLQLDAASIAAELGHDLIIGACACVGSLKIPISKFIIIVAVK
jgi:hypothetical protein